MGGLVVNQGGSVAKKEGEGFILRVHLNVASHQFRKTIELQVEFIPEVVGVSPSNLFCLYLFVQLYHLVR